VNKVLCTITYYTGHITRSSFLLLHKSRLCSLFKYLRSPTNGR